MDNWLSRIEADHSGASLAEKVISDKPADATDKCFVGSGSAAQSYRYVASTKGFAPGGYELLFMAASDPVTHAAPFAIS